MLGGRSCSESLLVIQSRTEDNLLEEQTIDLHAITISDTTCGVDRCGRDVTADANSLDALVKCAH